LVEAIEARCHAAWPFIVEAIAQRDKEMAVRRHPQRRSFSARQRVDS